MAKNTIHIDSTHEVINLLSELIVFNQFDFNQFLQKFIKIILKVTPTDSCLIYFYDREKKQLMLVGSKKTHDTEIEHIILKEGEGITGWVAAHKQTVMLEKEAYKDKRFKFFKELPEDNYESFLSVPIMDEEGVVGVINIQNKQVYQFNKTQIQTLESLGKIIASAFVETLLRRKVHSLTIALEERKIIEKAKGIIMRTKKVNEDEAFTFIRKEAMKHRKSLKEIAEAIILVM